MKKTQQKNYKLVYQNKLESVKDYFITEEEYFEYYQNACDPTFECYPFKLKADNVSKEHFKVRDIDESS